MYICLNKYCCLCCAMFYSCSLDVVYCFTILTVVPLGWHVLCSRMWYDGCKEMLLLQLLIDVIVAPCYSSQELIIISQLRDVRLSFLLFSNILTVVFYPDYGILPWLWVFHAFSSVAGKCQGIIQKDRARPALFPIRRKIFTRLVHR